MGRGLLISTYRGREDECGSEVWYMLSEMGVEGDIERLPLPGLLLVKLREDPLKIADKLRKIAEERPWDFRYILKVIPLEVLTEATLENLVKAVEVLSRKIPPEATFRVTLHRRSSSLRREEIIKAAAEKVRAKVDLNNPDYIVNIEIIGKIMGISVIRPDQVISISKIKEKELKRISGE